MKTNSNAEGADIPKRSAKKSNTPIPNIPYVRFVLNDIMGNNFQFCLAFIFSNMKIVDIEAPAKIEDMNIFIPNE